MFFIPYHSFEVAVQGSIPETEQFLADFVQPRRWWQRDCNDEAEFDGAVDERGFHIRIPFLEAPPLGIIVRGRFIQTGPGVVIGITMRPNALTLLFLGATWIYSMIRTWVVIANVAEGLPISSNRAIHAIGAIGAMAGVHGFILLHFNDAARPAKKRLIELFEDLARRVS